MFPMCMCFDQYLLLHGKNKIMLCYLLVMLVAEPNTYFQNVVIIVGHVIFFGNVHHVNMLNPIWIYMDICRFTENTQFLIIQRQVTIMRIEKDNAHWEKISPRNWQKALTSWKASIVWLYMGIVDPKPDLPHPGNAPPWPTRNTSQAVWFFNPQSLWRTRRWRMVWVQQPAWPEITFQLAMWDHRAGWGRAGRKQVQALDSAWPPPEFLDNGLS